ncbi:bifunctional metallophosphatase/5'-nucleotidase [Lutibacter sp.]|uniref:bifunctional metallophosphatase/5'-nucleotidase n=1 Tax=Lutibacter sp. TaxID=1925666 RepID=UPI0025C37C23|nr:bifunctional metallophosphatase/5'-nucleotidase [Lutibacter sp.]MCF6181804.1 bifunctional metallophosphatase/5'-nucleotidase [Lutibacter sp.]
MKKISYILVGLALILTSCAKQNNIVKFTFLQLNDVYEIAPLEGGKVGGMARVETLHQQLLKENPNTYLFLAGDFLNPSLLGTLKYKGKRIMGKQMIDVMNAMHFDLVAFGNHEFDLSESQLQNRLNESNFQWIATNLMHKIGDTIVPFEVTHNSIKTNIPKTVTFDIKNKEGKLIKIGFFSATINANPKDYIVYEDFYKTAKAAYNSLKNNTNIVFGLTHVNKENDKAILKMFPDVPLIMGGHEHVNMSIPVGNWKVTKADANAKTVYVHRITYNTKTKKITINSTLVTIDDKIKPNKKVKKIVDKWDLFLDEKLNKILDNPGAVLYHTDVPLDGRDTPIRSVQTNLGELITKSMAYAFDNKVDCAIVNGGSIRIDDELNGDITGFDIFRVLPFGGGILKVKLKGSLLKKVLEYGKLHAGKGAYLQRYLASYNTNDKTWIVNHKKIIDNKIYTVAFSDYLLKGYDIPFLTPENKGITSIYTPKKTETANDIRKVIISYLKHLKNK